MRFPQGGIRMIQEVEQLSGKITASLFSAGIQLCRLDTQVIWRVGFPANSSISTEDLVYVLYHNCFGGKTALSSRLPHHQRSRAN
jgi:hypothetical protein